MTETTANAYSSDSTQQELSNEYQDDRVTMIFKISFCIFVHWTKVNLAAIGMILKAHNKRDASSTSLIPPGGKWATAWYHHPSTATTTPTANQHTSQRKYRGSLQSVIQNASFFYQNALSLITESCCVYNCVWWTFLYWVLYMIFWVCFERFE